MSGPPPSGPSLLREITRRNRRALAASSGLLVLWAAGEAAVPMLIGLAIDHGVAGGDLRELLAWLAALAVTFLLLSFGYRFGARIADRVLNHETHRLRVLVGEHAISPTGSTAARSPGGLVSLATTDTDVAASFVGTVARSLAAACGVAAGAAYLLLVDWPLGLLVLVAVPASLAAVRALSAPMTAASEEQTAAMAAVSSRAADLMRGLRALKGIGGETVAAEAYRADGDRATAAGLRVGAQSAAIEAIQTTVAGLLLAAVAAVAGWRVIDGALTVGECVAVLGLVAYLAEPLSEVSELVEDVARSRASARRIETALRAGPLTADGPVGELPPRPEVRIGRLPLPGLAPLEAVVRPGELVAVTCEEQALGHALVAAFAGETGAEGIHLGGVARSDVTAVRAPTLLTVSPAAAEVLHGTVASNIAPAGTVDPTVVADAAIDDLLDGHPDGLDRPVSASGTDLSGGQRQRLALARALASTAPVLVLHEPTGAVDAVTEARIAAALRRRHDEDPDRTTIVVTTSAALLGVVDRVLVVRRDAPAVSGEHAELLRQDDAYARLVRR